MGELYHHGVKGMKWGVRKKPQYETVFTIPARKKKTPSKTSVKKSKNDNLTDEQLAAKKKSKRKKALMIAGYAAATVAISVAGAYAVSSPKVRGLVGKGMSMFDKDKMFEKHDDFAGYEYPTDRYGNKIVDIDAYMREHKTGLYKED